MFVPYYRRCARLVLIVANANATLSRESMSPPTTDLNISLGNAAVAQQEPQSEDRFSQDVENSVRHDFTIDRGLASTIGETPHTLR